MQSQAQRIHATFARLASEGADPGRIAEAAVTMWHDLGDALSPIVGLSGVAALYKRSLYLARVSYPWLAAVHEGSAQPGDFSFLRTALTQQTSSTAADAHVALLQTFHNLLNSLIGESLTERLLLPVYASLFNGDAVQDTSP